MDGPQNRMLQAVLASSKTRAFCSMRDIRDRMSDMSLKT